MKTEYNLAEFEPSLASCRLLSAQNLSGLHFPWSRLRSHSFVLQVSVLCYYDVVADACSVSPQGFERLVEQ